MQFLVYLVFSKYLCYLADGGFLNKLVSPQNYVFLAITDSNSNSVLSFIGLVGLNFK